MGLFGWLKPMLSAESAPAALESSAPGPLPSPLDHGAFRVGYCTDTGLRENNEDRWFVDETRGLFIVADGMGGQNAGEKASQLAVDMIPQELTTLLPTDSHSPPDVVREGIRQAVVHANAAIIDQGNADPSVSNMGTTVALACYRNGLLTYAHLGDSPVYRIRNGQIEILTEDHNLAQALYVAGTITREEIKTHRFRHVLWKYLGSKDATDGPDINVSDVRPGDRFVLASDGLAGVVEAELIRDYVLQQPDPQDCAKVLVQLALDKGSKDNVTVIVVYFDQT